MRFLAENEAENTVLLGEAVSCRRKAQSDAVMRWSSSACVAALSQRLLDRGWRYCLIFANRNNPTTTRIYPRLGYREIGAYARIGLKATA